MTDYRLVYDQFRWEVPPNFNFCRDTFDLHAQKKDRLAMWWVNDGGMERRLSFEHFVDRSKRLARVLQEIGVRKRDTVIVILPRLVEWWESVLACLRAGIVMSPGTTQLTARDIGYRLKAAEAVAVIADPESAAKVDEVVDESGARLRARIVVGGKRDGWTAYEEAVEAAPPVEAAETQADDPAILYFTSGTTGYPKMALHTQASYGIGHIITGKYWLGLTPDDLHWNLSDTGWAKAAYSSFFGPWIVGATVFVDHSPRFSAQRVLTLLSRYPITTLCAPRPRFVS